MKRTYKLYIRYFTFSVIGLLVVAEILLRQMWGFTHAPLYQESPLYEYIVKPSQDGYRFGRHYHYNSYSQRSEEPDSSKLIILGLGDSVIFGAGVIDQDSIATSLFTANTGIQMLNISCGSWGPDNCAAYLRAHGLFGAKALYLLVSSHDAYDNMDFQKVVGVHETYPDRQYRLAIAELYMRYIYPRYLKKLVVADSNTAPLDPDRKVLQNVGIRKKGDRFNPGFGQLKAIADSARIPLVVCLHPELGELQQGCYNEQGNEIIKWCDNHHIRLIQELHEGIKAEMYRDNIHLNEKGHRHQYMLMAKHLKPQLY